MKHLTFGEEAAPSESIIPMKICSPQAAFIQDKFLLTTIFHHILSDHPLLMIQKTDNNHESIIYSLPDGPWPLWMERVLSFSLLILLSPIFLVLMGLIKMTSPGPVFYRQRRTGAKGKDFHIYKFRTMMQNAESVTGPTLSWKGDPRITSLGKFLRASHLDELPQLLNVLKGEMSFIGPRPERPELIQEILKTERNYDLRVTIRPGITGLAQIVLPYDASPGEKLNWDLAYMERRNSRALNMAILFYTVKKMIWRQSNFMK